MHTNMLRGSSKLPPYARCDATDVIVCGSRR